MNERETYSIYKEQLGEKHEKTQEASDCLQHLTQQAVVLQRKVRDCSINYNPEINSYLLHCVDQRHGSWERVTTYPNSASINGFCFRHA